MNRLSRSVLARSVLLALLLFALAPVTLDAGPGTTKLDKVGKLSKVPKLKKTGAVSAAGTTAGSLSGDREKIRRALQKAKQPKLKRLSDLNGLGFRGVAEQLQRRPVHHGAAQVYVGHIDGESFYVKRTTEGISYGLLSDYMQYKPSSLLLMSPNKRRSEWIVEPEALDAGISSGDLMASRANIRVARDGGRTWQTRVLRGEQAELAVIYSPSVQVKVSKGTSITDLRRLDTRKFETDNVQILSHFEDSADLDSVRKLTGVGQRANVGYDNINAENLQRHMSKHAGKTVAMVGHVEQEVFVAYKADGSVASRIPIARIQELARDNDIHMLYLGCSTAQSHGVAGYLRKVQSFEVARRLERALKTDSVGDFYSALGTRKNPILVKELAIVGDEPQFENLSLLADAVQQAGPDSLNVRSVPKEETDWSGIVELVFYAFIVGCFLLVFKDSYDWIRSPKFRRNFRKVQKFGKESRRGIRDDS